MGLSHYRCFDTVALNATQCCNETLPAAICTNTLLEQLPCSTSSTGRPTEGNNYCDAGQVQGQRTVGGGFQPLTPIPLDIAAPEHCCLWKGAGLPMGMASL